MGAGECRGKTKAQYLKEYSSKIDRWYFEYKSKQTCQHCGHADYRALQFHHIDPSYKSHAVGVLVNRRNSQKRIMEEIEKCIVLCVNCHRIQTSQDFKFGQSEEDTRYTRRAKWMREYKSCKSCQICGFNKSPYALQFHHVDPSTKSFEIGDAVRKAMRVEKILAEIEKCVILCGNCHFSLHREEEGHKVQ